MILISSKEVNAILDLSDDPLACYVVTMVLEGEGDWGLEPCLHDGLC
jgi:hypothetical protein